MTHRYQRRTPRPAPKGDTTRQIARINELSQTARTTWFALLGYLAFVGVTLLGVQDADFFIASRETNLPLIGVSIPTASFFIFAPILGAALYIYLHLHLRKLWEALHDPPSMPSGRPLDEQIYPWLVNDLVLRLRDDNAATPRPLDRIAGFVTRLLVWVAGPFVLLAFWWRSMPAHDEWMTLLIALVTLLSLYSGFTSWWHLRTCRLPEDRRKPPWSGRWKRPSGILAALMILTTSWLRTEAGIDFYVMKAIDFYERAFNSGVSLDRFRDRKFPNGDPMDPQEAQEEYVDSLAWVWTLDDLTADPLGFPLVTSWLVRLFSVLDGNFIVVAGETSTLARTDLRGVEIVPGTADLATRDVARRRFRAEWCARNGLAPGVCGNLYTVAEPAPWFIEPNRHAWCLANYAEKTVPPKPENTESTKVLGVTPAMPVVGNRSTLTPKAIAECDQHFNGLDQEFRTEWQQERDSTLARLERRDLRGRDLRNADMAQANLTGADLSEARMEGANLWQARMEGANLSFARMEGADLSEARMEGANLSGARMEGANLSGARVEGANLSGGRTSARRGWKGRTSSRRGWRGRTSPGRNSNL